VTGIDTHDASTELAHARLPTDSIDLGERDENAIYELHVAATDDANNTLLRGLTFPVQLGALEGASIPVFVQRLGEMARLPEPLTDGREAPLCAAVVGRYLTLAGGGDASRAAVTQIYDLASLSPFTNPPTLPRTPHTLAALGSRLLLIDDAGATWLELADSTTTVADAPSGGTWADVSGGTTLATPDGGSFVVGATRAATNPGATGPTARVLRIAADGTLSFVSLTQARLGAAAVYLDGRGLVVEGGSASGAGAEVLAIGATAALPLPYPADATAGAALAAIDATHLLVAGGVGHEGETRVMDLGCAGACELAAGPVLPSPLSRADGVSLSGFEAGGADILLVGDDASGASHAVRVSGGTATEVSFKVSRRGARPVRVTAMQSVVIAGGATVLESFVP
jgi:hypothetical protein